MRPRMLLTILMLACALAACRDDETVVVTQSSGAPPAPSTSAPQPVPTTADIAPPATAPTTTRRVDVIRAQIATATSDVCTLTTADDVRQSFQETKPLTTQPMGEAKGPACGYPHPRDGGYLLVIQFQDMAAWGAHQHSGKVVEGLGRPAVLSSRRAPELYVLDQERSAVVMFLAPDSALPSAAPLFDVAARIYGVPREGVQLGA